MYHVQFDADDDGASWIKYDLSYEDALELCKGKFRGTEDYRECTISFYEGNDGWYYLIYEIPEEELPCE
jgi:hypothetical protein